MASPGGPSSSTPWLAPGDAAFQVSQQSPWPRQHCLQIAISWTGQGAGAAGPLANISAAPALAGWGHLGCRRSAGHSPERCPRGWHQRLPRPACSLRRQLPEEGSEGLAGLGSAQGPDSAAGAIPRRPVLEPRWASCCFPGGTQQPAACPLLEGKTDRPPRATERRRAEPVSAGVGTPWPCGAFRPLRQALGPAASAWLGSRVGPHPASVLVSVGQSPLGRGGGHSPCCEGWERGEPGTLSRG